MKIKQKVPLSFNVRSIQFIITLSFTLLTVCVVLIVCMLLYNKFARTAESNAYLNIQQIVEQVNAHLELYVNGMEDVYEVIEQLIDQNEQIADPILAEQLTTLLQSREDLVSVSLFTPEGDLVLDVPALPMLSNSRLTEQSWFVSAVKKPDQLSFSPPHIQNLYKNQYKWVVSLSRMITYRDHDVIREGILLVDVNFRTIDELSSKVTLGKKGYAYIIDELGNLVYHPQQQLIYAGLKYENMEPVFEYAYGSYEDKSLGEDRYVTIRTVQPIGWKVVGVAYPDEMITTKRDLNKFIMWFLILVIVIVILLSVYISARISRPIRRLERAVKGVGKGDFNTPIDIKGAYEVEQLSRRFNHMLFQIRELMQQIIHEQEAKRNGELDVLQAQINPHFLYNTLNSVIRLAERGRNEEVITAIQSLSKFFRISLSKGKHYITVAEELEHVRHYLIIQKIRFKNKFRYCIKVDDSVQEAMTMKLILQPLVENAIHHGIAYIQEEGVIEITVRRIGDQIQFKIADNGVGMSQQTLAQLLTGEIRDAQGSGVGVRNVQERIQLAYGSDYGMTIQSELEEGTTVTLTLPYVEPSNEPKDNFQEKKSRLSSDQLGEEQGVLTKRGERDGQK